MPSQRKNILIISNSFLHRDPRILRQIQALKNNYEIQTLGLTNPNIDGVDFFESKIVRYKNTGERIHRLFMQLLHGYEKILEKRYAINHLFSNDYKMPAAIFANDIDGLYVAIRLKNEKDWDCKIYFDSHEYFPRYRESLFWKTFEQPLVRYIFKQAKDQFAIMSTVCPTGARMYEEYLGFAPGTVRVITNSPAYEPGLEPQPVGEKIRLIHHGGAMRVRQLDKMIDMMAYLPADRYELTFMLVKSEEAYYESLVRKASRYPNIRFAEPVPVHQIPYFTNQFDIGLFILNNNNISYRYALPNKFFEFVQARLAIAVGDSPEMRSYIEKYQLGVSAKKNTAKAMAEEILKLSKDDIMRLKQSAHEHARELSAEANITRLRDIAGELTD